MDENTLLNDLRYASDEMQFCARQFDEHRTNRCENELARVYAPPPDDDFEFLFRLDQLRRKERLWLREKRKLTIFRKRNQ